MWWKSVESRPRLETYRKFKKNLELEEYLDVLEGQKRRQVVEIRSGVNQLEDEQGRRKRVPKEERVCKVCGNGIENEEHLLLVCPLYQDIRTAWKKDIGVQDSLEANKT